MILNSLIMEEFLRDYAGAYTGSFISQKKGLNQKTVSNYLNILEKEHILRSVTEGKNKKYSLNKENKEILKHFILAIEHLRTIDFYKKYPLIKEVAEKIQKHIQGTALLFGSYAKGIAKKDSDIDILIIGTCNEKEITKIELIYNVDINLKIYNKIEKDILFKEAIKNHILLKNFETFTEDMLHE
ncbi:nucleotidyltransferase domain-containing protein [Candidatus Woesearchaeota archaeon]|nr:nucleotidyltransferase domain-containing protein [Candidatus Woesearchaeota archaeon]